MLLDNMPYEPNGFIIFRRSQTADLTPLDREPEDEFWRESFPESLVTLLDEYQLTPMRLIQSVEPDVFYAIEKEIKENAIRGISAPPYSLTTYWRLDMREQMENLETILEELNDEENKERYGIDFAYARGVVTTSAAVQHSDDPLAGEQDYLTAADLGIGAKWAWLQNQGAGNGVNFFDIELGWRFNHQDIAAWFPPGTTVPYYNDNYPPEIEHGTAILGIVAGQDNTLGGIGIAPEVNSVTAVSAYKSSDNSNDNIEDALAAILIHPLAQPGDVVLIELEVGNLPIEIDQAIFDTIQTAVLWGLVVVEAAGNANADITPFLLGDSGAIMVASAHKDLPHNRWPTSNFGGRIDCYAWGEGVTTSGFGDLSGQDTTAYTNAFGGTSAAAAIVAGAALVLQSVHEHYHGERLLPMPMRKVLSDETYNTPSNDPIGVMPDLLQLISQKFLITPDIYIRDSTGDDGLLPSTGIMSMSPDIIVRSSIVADPQNAFGENSGHENNQFLSHPVKENQTHFIYVRMINGGPGAATNVTATVYWSRAATLLKPSQWTLIGQTVAIDLPDDNDKLMVAGPINWPAAAIPNSGHYCFVAILDSAEDPAPPLPPALTVGTFSDFVRNNNNMAWRNFNVVPIGNANGLLPLPFHIVGLAGGEDGFELEIRQRLAPEVEVRVVFPLKALPMPEIIEPLALPIQDNYFSHVVPPRWLEHGDEPIEEVVEVPLLQPIMARRQPSTSDYAIIKAYVNDGQQVIDVPLPAWRLVRQPMHLAADADYTAAIVIQNAEKLVHGNTLMIRQRFRGKDVGRITWVFRH